MITKVKAKEFKKKFLFNEHRKNLYNILIDELEKIESRCTCFEFLIFGSFITRKQKPGDIDVLVSIIPKQDNVYSIMTDGLQQEHFEELDVHFIKNQYFLRDVDGLLDFFNENPFNKNKGIFIKKAVEIVDI